MKPFPILTRLLMFLLRKRFFKLRFLEAQEVG